MTYTEAVDFLYARLPMFQRSGAAALKYDLSNTQLLLEALGTPQVGMKFVHVAGTNGKGTSCHTLSAISTSAGYRTGLFTSPHLKSFTERFRVDGQEMDEGFVIDFLTKNIQLIEHIKPSFFELTFAMALCYFRDRQVDLAIVEVGLGGRLDSTNVITPLVCLITMIGLDHTDLLGDSLEKIASEKAGIIKLGAPVVIGANQPELLHVFQAKAAQVGTTLVPGYHWDIAHSVKNEHTITLAYGDQSLDLIPQIQADYYLRNLSGILTTVQQLNLKGFQITEAHIAKGIENVNALSGLKGRWQQINENPLIVADVSHNEIGLDMLFRQVAKRGFDQVHLIFGVVRDKDLSSILNLLKQQDWIFYFTQSQVARSMNATELKQYATNMGIDGVSFENVNVAISEAIKSAGDHDLILVCGSTFVVAEIEGL